MRGPAILDFAIVLALLVFVGPLFLQYGARLAKLDAPDYAKALLIGMAAIAMGMINGLFSELETYLRYAIGAAELFVFLWILKTFLCATWPKAALVFLVYYILQIAMLFLWCFIMGVATLAMFI